MLKLIINEYVDNANLKLRWCVDESTYSQLREEGGFEPFILVVILSGKDEMSRHLFPLDQLLAFIPLYRPGENQIFATIVWSNKGKKGLWKKYIAQEDGRYKTDLFGKSEDEEEDEREFMPPRNSLELTKMTVNVPSKLFGKPVSGWEKEWLNRYYRWDFSNQCHVRKARMFAYSLWLVIFPIEIVLSFICRALGALWYLSLFYEGINFKAIFTPWKGDVRDVWWRASFSLKVQVTEEETSPSLFYKLSFLPLIILIILLLAFLGTVMKYPPSDESHLLFLFLALCIFCWGFLFLAFVDIVWNLIVWLNKAFGFFWSLRFQRWLSKIKKRFEEEDYFETVTCDRDLIPEVRALPRSKRTIELRFLDFKARVCKPLPK